MIILQSMQIGLTYQIVKYNVNSMTIDKKKNKFYIRCFVGVETEEYITGDEYEYRLK